MGTDGHGTRSVGREAAAPKITKLGPFPVRLEFYPARLKSFRGSAMRNRSTMPVDLLTTDFLPLYAFIGAAALTVWLL